MNVNDVGPLAIVLFMILINERLVEVLYTRFLKRLFERFAWDKSWLMLIAWLTGGLLVLATEINLFAEYIPNWWIGWILTGLVAGGGSNLLHDLFSAFKPRQLDSAAIGEIVEHHLGHPTEEDFLPAPDDARRPAAISANDLRGRSD